MNLHQLPFTLLLFALLGTASHSAFSQRLSASDKAAIEEKLSIQQNAWNEGDVDAFMEGYWRSNDLAFIGASGPTYGWQETLDNYKKRYPDRKAMGKLRFDILKYQKVDKRTAFVIGRFYLSRDASIGDLSGTFSLVWRKFGKDWLIISDHTSADN